MGNPKPVKLQAHEILCGHAVHRPNEIDSKTLFIKAERKGADYIHHYLIPLSLDGTTNLSLVYIDPEESLIDWGCIPVFDLLSSKAYKKPDVGHIFKNKKGIFLKVNETPKSQKMFAFIDIKSGEVKRRQERDVIKVYDFWEISNTF